MISIIVPAYNEATVIELCLRALTDGADPGEIEIIVAANGCIDDTVARARAFGEPVRVVETSVGSKIAALNLGDAAAIGYPRCYIDADVEVGIEQIRQVAAMLDGHGVLAAAPRMRVDTSGASPLVKAFYAVWLRQPFHGKGMVGGGFYAVSQQGRARFDRFPEIIADDEFIRSLFKEHERATPEGCSFTIRSPRTLRDLIKVKTRSRLGLYQLRRRFPELADNSRAKTGKWWEAILPRPWLWPAAGVYLFVNVATRLRAKRQLKTIEDYQWERDESSRRAAGAVGS